MSLIYKKLPLHPDNSLSAYLNTLIIFSNN